MGIFEDVILNARSAVDSVGKKAGKVIDMSKLTIAAADLRSEISKKYQILGRVVYEIKKRDLTVKKTEELVEKIKELKEQLSSVTEAIENSKQKKKCPYCGLYNAKGAVFCNKCGEKLPMAESGQNSADDEDEFIEDDFDDDEIGL